MTLLGLILAYFFVPRASELKKHNIVDKAPVSSAKDVLRAFNPAGVFRAFKYPNILATVILSSCFERHRR